MNLWNEKKVTVLGHRGYKSKYPENTILSFLEAVKNGADGIELDVWLTKDGNIAILHDDNLNRVAHVDKKIKEMSLEEVKSIDLKGDQKIPTLNEVFASMPENSIINVEIKDPDAVEKTIDCISKHNIKDRVMISSFNIDALKKVRNLDKNITLGLLIEDEKIIPQVPYLAKDLNLQSVNLPIDALQLFPLETFRETIINIRKLGLKIILWADNDELYYTNENVLKVIDIVDTVITDDIVRMKKLLEQHSKNFNSLNS